MWFILICGLVISRLIKLFLFDNDGVDVETYDVETYDATSLFSVAERLEKIYGGKVYVGLQIPDADSGTRRNIDAVLITEGQAIVVSVKNISGLVTIEKDGSWSCEKGHKHRAERLPDPVSETRHLVPVLESYLEQRGIELPEGYFSCKVICPNPNFRAINGNCFPSEVITYYEWLQLKAETKNTVSGWIKGAFRGAKKEMHDSVHEKLHFILSTAPTCDRLELKGNKCILGEFMEFKGKQDDVQALKNIRRSKVSRLVVQKISMFSLARSTLQVLYSPRDYQGEGAASSEWKEVSVRSSTEVVFEPQDSGKVRKYKLSSVTALSLSA